MDNETGLLFAGLRVLDVGTWIAGPVAATMLADFGADVIKVEAPGEGDPYRRLSLIPSMPQSPLNYTWMADARNKRSITLNLKSDEGRAILMQLVAQCDVYVTNQPLPMRRAFRLTYADLQPLNPRMIYASLTAYGETGPDADREGFDGVAWWSRSGLMDLVRAPGAMPGGSVPGMGDHPTAVSLYAAIVTALLRRDRTGEGGEVHTSLLANGVWSNLCLAQGALSGGDFSGRGASVVPAGPSRLLYETADGRLLQLYMIRTAEELDRMLVAAERTDLLADPRFADADSRMAHMDAFLPALQEMFRSRTAAEWMQLFRAADVPVTLVALVEELPQDTQIHAAGVFLAPAAGAEGPNSLIINHPVNVVGLRTVGPMPAPGVGEHTAEILAQLGYTPDDITGLGKRGVL